MARKAKDVPVEPTVDVALEVTEIVEPEAVEIPVEVSAEVERGHLPYHEAELYTDLIETTPSVPEDPIHKDWFLRL